MKEKFRHKEKQYILHDSLIEILWPLRTGWVVDYLKLRLDYHSKLLIMDGNLMKMSVLIFSIGMVRLVCSLF